MNDYLNYQFEDSENFVKTFDEAPLWSMAFGLFLLEHVELKTNTTIVDMGSGAGFPLLELAGRAGSSCKLYGVDPWVNANKRAKEKIKNYDYHNVEILECSAEKIPLAPNSVDLIVSNLGINNFEKPEIVFKECNRLLKPKGKLALCTNINGHWKLFYDIFEQTLRQLDKIKYIEVVEQQQVHRGSLRSISSLFSSAGLNVTKHFEKKLEMKYVDGSAFLNHHFVKLGWLSSWLGIFTAEERAEIFKTLEQNLNEEALRSGGLKLSVPILFLEGEKA